MTVAPIRNSSIWPTTRQSGVAELRDILIKAHKEVMGDDRGLVIGLQLTHSGRFCKPNDNNKFESIIAYNHPLLDRKFGYPADRPVISDDEIKRLIEDFRHRRQARRGNAATTSSISNIVTAISATSCSARVTRPGPYGGSLENRTRFLREIVEGIRAEAPRPRASACG